VGPKCAQSWNQIQTLSLLSHLLRSPWYPLVQPIPLGVTFSNAVSKLKAQSSNVSFHWNALRPLRWAYSVANRPYWNWMNKNMSGHSWKKIAHISRNSWGMNGRACGCIGKAQFCAILEPNTNAQRMSLLSHLLRSLLAAIGRDCYSLLRIL